MTKAPAHEVFKVVRDLGVRTLLFGSIVLTLVILAAVLLSRSLTENIWLLSERMNAVSTGDLSSTIQLKGNDETVQLANTFNSMIKDLKFSRDELEKMNRELDQKVKERTLQLEEQNQKVKEAQEALLRTTRMASVGEIAGRTAHEVLNPLTSLLTRTGLMQKRVNNDYSNQLTLFEDIKTAWMRDFKDGGFERLIQNWQSPSPIKPDMTLFEEDLENLNAIARDLQSQSQSINADTEFIKHEGNRISRIINGMRRLGHVKSDVKEHSLHGMLGDSCNIMADLFDQKSFALKRQFNAEDDKVMCDRDELIQSITNLMRNSHQALLEAVKKGELTQRPYLAVTTFNKDSQLVIDIEDNGIGILTEHQLKLFNSNFTTKSADEGTGLGLGISRRFVRNCGGEIEFVSSIPRLKTLFRIRLPLANSSKNSGAVA